MIISAVVFELLNYRVFKAMSSYPLKYQDCWALIQNTLALSLATVTADGDPECSYTPYLFQEQAGFFILISELSSHTSNLRLNGKAGVLITQPESDIHQAFARPRVRLSCQAVIVTPDSEIYRSVVESMQSRLGETVEILTGLPDFSLWQLKPLSGRWISGFGKAIPIGQDSGLLPLQK